MESSDSSEMTMREDSGRAPPYGPTATPLNPPAKAEGETQRIYVVNDGAKGE